MKIAVIGANGNIGTRVVKLLLSNNYEVRALVHGRHNELPTHSNLTIIEGDIRDQASIRDVITGTESVIITLGSWGTPTKDILTTGMKTLVPAMQNLGIMRLISLTGSGVLLPSDTTKWYDHLNPLLLRIVQPKILFDGAEHIAILQKSSLDWTVLRSPIMRDGAANGYALSTTAPGLWRRIARDDVAQALVDQLASSEHLHQAPFIK
jgi:putative NADH-flavin reductase